VLVEAVRFGSAFGAAAELLVVEVPAGLAAELRHYRVTVMTSQFAATAPAIFSFDFEPDLPTCFRNAVVASALCSWHDKNCRALMS
jgi:hypothetical protein